MFRLFNNLVYTIPPETNTGGNTGLPAGSGKEDIIEFLGDDEPDEKEIIPLDEKDDKSGEKPGKEGKDGKKEKSKSKEKESVKDDDAESEDEDEPEDEEEDELKELEDELEGPTDEQLELVTPVRRSEILKKFPTLFKEFPYLEKAYYREQQYTELLPTIDDAKEVISKAAVLDNFEKDLMGGNTEVMLKAVKAESPNSFNKIVDNYMNTLAAVDEKAYHHVLGNTIKQTIIAMVQEGRTSNNEVLQNAAQILNQFVFGSSNFQPPQKLSSDDKPDSKPDDDVSKEKQQFINERFTTTRDELNTRVNNSLKSTIDAHIDPKQSMTDYVRRNASRDALETLETLINKDTRFKTLVDRLWQKSVGNKFDKASVDTIRSAYLSKAKTLLPAVIKKARNEALRGMGKRVAADKDDQPLEKNGPRNTNTNNKNSEQPRSRNDSGKSKGIPSGMSTLEFLMTDD